MNEREQAEHAAVAWITRRDAGDWTSADAAAFEAWLAASLHHRAAYYRLHAAWVAAGRLAALQPARSPVQSRRPGLRGLFTRGPVALAASLLLALAGFALYGQREGSTQEFSTGVGGLQTVKLAEGSEVTLNTDSAIRVQLRAGERRVQLLRGEAFFQVAKDPRRPFVVQAEAVQVVAVGTAFSVQRADARTQVLVSEGLVRVDLGQPGTLPASLPAGSMLRAAADGARTLALPQAEIEQLLSWRSGLLVFRDTPLVEAVAQFNRYNSRKMVLAVPEIGELRIGGVFRATDQEVFLRLLETGFPVRAESQQDRLVLYPR